MHSRSPLKAHLRPDLAGPRGLPDLLLSTHSLDPLSLVPLLAPPLTHTHCTREERPRPIPSSSPPGQDLLACLLVYPVPSPRQLRRQGRSPSTRPLRPRLRRVPPRRPSCRPLLRHGRLISKLASAPPALCPCRPRQNSSSSAPPCPLTSTVTRAVAIRLQLRDRCFIIHHGFGHHGRLMPKIFLLCGVELHHHHLEAPCSLRFGTPRSRWH